MNDFDLIEYICFVISKNIAANKKWYDINH